MIRYGRERYGRIGGLSSTERKSWKIRVNWRGMWCDYGNHPINRCSVDARKEELRFLLLDDDGHLVADQP